MGAPLTEWEYDLVWTEKEDRDHDFIPVHENASKTGERQCKQVVVEGDNMWHCTRPAEPQHRQHIAHCGKHSGHDHLGDCARMAWTGPLSGV